jgi:hypothetical protein
MIDRGGELSVKRQAELLEVSRASVYYRPRPISAQDLKLMRRIDELRVFEQLTSGKAVFGHPGKGGCHGPYKVAKFLLEGQHHEVWNLWKSRGTGLYGLRMRSNSYQTIS